MKVGHSGFSRTKYRTPCLSHIGDWHSIEQNIELHYCIGD